MDSTNGIEQRSHEWNEQRLGKFTASEMYKLMTEPRKKEDKERGELSEGAKTYVLDKIAEVLTGERPEISTWQMAWGVQYESLARQWFEKLTGLKVTLTGFTSHGDYAGGSSDGETSDGAIIEIKCPAVSTNHVKHLLIDSPEYFKAEFPDYYYQMQSNMMFTGVDKGYFVSFDPRMDSDSGMFIYTLYKNEADCQAILKKIDKAVEYKNQVLSKLQPKEIAA